MTTKLIIENDPTSNGDVVIDGYNTCEGNFKKGVLTPGKRREIWVTDYSAVIVTETWPTSEPAPKISDGDIIAECGDRGAAWAAAYCRKNPVADYGTMLAWFCNAIEAACSVRAARNQGGLGKTPSPAPGDKGGLGKTPSPAPGDKGGLE